MLSIRPAPPHAFALLPAVERDAAQAFLSFPALASLAQSEPLPVSFYETLPRGAAVFVAEEGGALVGFVVCTFVDGQPHLKELSVRHACARRGIGSALLTKTIDWARANNHCALTLTTFRDIPFNAPFYARHGFEIFSPNANWPALSELCKKEAALFPAPRVAMVCGLCARLVL